MYDNKIRLSPDVLEKAELIAQEWGLKNARAAVEAVFRKYADEYLGRRSTQPGLPLTDFSPLASRSEGAMEPSDCEALSELDDLLGL